MVPGVVPRARGRLHRAFLPPLQNQKDQTLLSICHDPLNLHVIHRASLPADQPDPDPDLQPYMDLTPISHAVDRQGLLDYLFRDLPIALHTVNKDRFYPKNTGLIVLWDTIYLPIDL